MLRKRIMMEQEKPSYYAVIPATVRYDHRLKPNEKLLYGEITSLTNKTGNCYATNKYFAKLYDVKVETISRWIKKLKDFGYIESELEFKTDTKSIEKRIIKVKGIPIDKKVNTYIPNNQEGIDEKVKENNTSINNNKKENKKRKVFEKPNLEEIKKYCEEQNLKIDCQYFFDYYESNGWLVGKNKMKDWKATLRNWERRSKKSNENGKRTFDEVFSQASNKYS